MGKVKGAFGGLETKGTIAKTYTFANWKGIQVVKKKPTPANPRTADQVANRNQMTDAVGYWHNTQLTVIDKQAWNLRAQKGSKPMSGFNSLIQRVRLAGLANTWCQMYNAHMLAGIAGVVPDIIANVNGQATFMVIRGPAAGYSETLPCVAGVTTFFTELPISESSLAIFTVIDGAGNVGESGAFYVAVL